MTPPIRLLFIQGAAREFVSIKQHLHEQGLAADITHVEDHAQLTVALKEGPWGVVLVDYEVKVFDKMLATLEPLMKETPVLLLANRSEEQRAAQTLERGVWDYICRDNLIRLVPAIKRAMGEAATRHSCRLAEEALRVSEQQRAVVLNSVTSHIAVLDAKGRIIATNAAWRRFALENSHRADAMPPHCDIGGDYLTVCRQSQGSSSEGAMAAHDGIEAVLKGRLDRFELEYPCHSATEQRWFLMTATPQHPAEGAVIAHINITERKLAELALAKSEARYRALFDEAVDGILLMTVDGSRLQANAAFARMHGYSRAEEIEGLQLLDLLTPETARLTPGRLQRASQGDILGFEVEHYRKDKTTFWLSVTLTRVQLGDGWYLQAYHRDITDQRRRAQLQLLPGEVLQILNDSRALPHATKQILKAIRTATGVEAVGIRLRHGEDFPYAATDGFSDSFIEAENSVAAPTPPREFCLNEQGTVCLECTCGLVLSGKTGAEGSRFTPGGSAWTNDASAALALPADQDPRLHPRNRCIHEGFQSVALIPIRIDNEIIGLLQLNDRRKGCFTLEMVQFFEGLASSFGVALQRLKEERALRENRNTLRSLFDAIPESLFLMSVDGMILAANAGFAARFQKSVDQCTGQSIFQLVPSHLVEARHRWIAEVVRSQAPVVNEEPWGQRWLRHNYCPVFSAEGQLERIVVLAVDITERKNAEEQLQRSERRFRSLVESSPVAMGFVDHDGAITLLNRRFTELFGYSADQIQKLEDWWRLAYPNENYRQEVISTWKRAIQSKTRSINTTPPREWLVTCSNGAVLTVQVSSIVLAEGVLTSFVDLTTHKRAEARAARDKLRTEFLLDLHQRAAQLTEPELYDHVLNHAVRLTGSAISFFHQISEDQQSILLTTWNHAAKKVCGVSHEILHSLSQLRNWEDCLRDQRPIINNHYQPTPIRKGHPAGQAALGRIMTIPVIRDGKVRIIFGVGNKASDYDEDDVAQMQVVANGLHVIMLERAAQNQLHRSEQRFRHLVETTYDWIWEVDATSRYTYASPKVLDLLGYAPEEVLGRTPFDLMPPEEAQRVALVFGEIASKRESFSGLENTNLHKNGREVVLETSGMPVLSEQGELLGYRGMDRDITERKRLESQLRQAQKLEAIGQLAGGVAHDFNNILAAIQMQLSLLEMKEDLDEETRLGLEDMHEGANRAANLTRQLLMFSRRSVLAMKALDLGEVIENLLKMLHRLIGEDIRLSFVRKKRLPRVEADAGMLEQVLMNLVVNARDAMPRGKGGRIDIATSVVTFETAEHVYVPERRQGTFLCLSVKDTGCGMDAATLKRIFEPFFTTKEPGKGTGLGLATVHGIVAQHKGWVEVESHVGKGTQFRVYLPALAGSVEAEITETSRTSVERGQEAILVVEDENNLRRSVVQALRVLGYRVYEADNGQKAMVLWQEHKDELDLLLTDMVMPEGMTGLELAQQLQEMKPALKVIVSSGYSSEVVQSGGIKQPGIWYLPKPYEIETLSETIRACLAGKK